ncbi:hypothetical protein T492DRAFT_458507 [Pavlovales sp. CCMP2436]|nr:hypothetical protein T492DRAFT_458507 [Pavlovales sp. CCMP2436]|mmetsp:Transcript_28918/g.66404  ORF Transcript_28918/g.66404 Transcript_28918/m.66404 type:complete len:251 (-) Transcript_28918:824-1576(-)
MRVLLVLAAVAHARLSGRPAAPAPTRSALGRCSAVAMAVGGDDTPLDMGLLSQRITSLQRSGVDDSARGSVLPILVLDSMLPRQKITISMDDEAGLKLIKDCVDRYDSKLGVHGVDPVTNLVNPAGTQVLITSRSGCFVELVGQRRYLLTGKPVRIEETYYTCELEWCCVDEAAGKELIAAAGALEPLIARWMQLVRQGREKEPRQLDEVLAGKFFCSAVLYSSSAKVYSSATTFSNRSRKPAACNISMV